MMKIATAEPLYTVHTVDGPHNISHPVEGDQLAVLEESGRYTLPRPIIGWARGLDGELSVYTAGEHSSLWRLALEDGCEEECFFTGRVPDMLHEYRLDEYAPGALLFFPVPVAPALMNVSPTLQLAA